MHLCVSVLHAPSQPLPPPSPTHPPQLPSPHMILSFDSPSTSKCSEILSSFGWEFGWCCQQHCSLCSASSLQVLYQIHFHECVCCWERCIYCETVCSVRRQGVQWFQTPGEWADVFPVRRTAGNIPLPSRLQAPWIQNQQLRVWTLVPRHPSLRW